MSSSLQPEMLVRLSWVSRHAWEARRMLHHPTPVPTFWFLEEGAVHLTLGGQLQVLSAGQAVLIPALVPRTIFTPGGARWLSIGWELLAARGGELLSRLPLPIIWQPAPEDAAFLRASFARMMAGWGTQALPERLVVDGNARGLLGYCLQSIGAEVWQTAFDASLPDWLGRVLHAFQLNPALSVAELASAAGYSPAQFRRLFARYLQQSPMAYLHHYRLKTAQQLLLTTDLPVSVIAERLGFASAAHFTRLFKAQLGATPRDYRRQDEGRL